MTTMDPLRRQYLDAMGIEVWSLRKETSSRAEQSISVDEAVESVPVKSAAAKSVVVESGILNKPVSTTKLSSLDEIEQQVEQCTACSLHQGRMQTVFGAGDTTADWMLIGEAPGREEDRQGIPFVGRAGQLLTAMLHAIGFKRDEVYIANVLKCRPPNNRDPAGEEVVKCEPYLHKQVELVEPKIIIAMGRFAAQSLLKTTMAIGKLRGRRHVYGETGIPLIVTYHPAYLLRNPVDKRKSWEDLLLAKSVVDEISGESRI